MAKVVLGEVHFQFLEPLMQRLLMVDGSSSVRSQ
jgi:hypothetical protein